MEMSQKRHARMTLLAPPPQKITLDDDSFHLTDGSLIAIQQPELLFEAQRARDALAGVGVHWEIALTTQGRVGLSLASGMDSLLTQSYTLSIRPNHISIHGSDAAGVFYGVCTLSQILQQHGAHLPCMSILDFPDVRRRGVMLDISRDRVPTLATLLELVDLLASWKINELQLYTEHTFAYRAHPLVWQNASPITSEELLILRAYCQQRHIDLMPNLNTLGHMERWLKHPPYNPLAEMPEGFPSPWHDDQRILPPSTLNPRDPRSLALVRSLLDELLPHFTSEYVNVGGDEPWELGKGASKDTWETEPGRVYLEYLKALHVEVTRRARRMQFWADIIVKYPALVSELPRDAIAMIWGYEADEPKEADAALIAASGLQTYMVPGTSTWNSLAGRTTNMISNLNNAARLAHTYSSLGYLITDWGDNGHWQPLSAAYAGFLYGASVSWNYAGSQTLDLAEALSVYAFADSARAMGRIALHMGDLYRKLPIQIGNGTALFYLLQLDDDEVRAWQQTADTSEWCQALSEVDHTLDELLSALDNVQLERDAQRVKAEYQQVAKLLKAAVQRGLSWFGQTAAVTRDEARVLLDQQRANWLARHRLGGLEDSLRRMRWLYTQAL
jgi:hexosaminidase